MPSTLILVKAAFDPEAAVWSVESSDLAIRVLDVRNFGPFLVESDLAGNSLFESQNRTINTRIEQLYAGLKSPSLRRYDETTSREDEVI